MYSHTFFFGLLSIGLGFVVGIILDSLFPKSKFLDKIINYFYLALVTICGFAVVSIWVLVGVRAYDEITSGFIEEPMYAEEEMITKFECGKMMRKYFILKKQFLLERDMESGAPLPREKNWIDRNI